MKAITLPQPLATLVAYGLVHFPTRLVGTQYRGRVAIHASARPVDFGFFGKVGLTRMDVAFKHLGVDVAALPRGAVLGVCDLTDCHSVTAVDERTTKAIAQEWCFGDFGTGRYAFEVHNMERFETPVPARGFFGLWEWNKGSASRGAVLEYQGHRSYAAMVKRTGGFNA